MSMITCHSSIPLVIESSSKVKSHVFGYNVTVSSTCSIGNPCFVIPINNITFLSQCLVGLLLWFAILWLVSKLVTCITI